MEQREGREPELRLQLLAELVPYARIAAVVYKAAHIAGEVFARHHHRCGSSHGYAVYHHPERIAEESRSRADPLHHVQPVEPAHLDGLASALSRMAQVGHQDVVSERMVVHVSDVEHVGGTVSVSVNHQRRVSRRTGGIRIERVESRSVGSRDERVFQCFVPLQAVCPRSDGGIVLAGFGDGFAHAAFRPVGAESIVNQIHPPSDGGGHESQQRNAGSRQQFLFHADPPFHSFQMSHDAKAWSRSISSPFFTIAPWSLPFFMKSVVSGL